MESFNPIQLAKGPSLFLLSAWQEKYPHLTSGFTGRNGGVSESRWSSLNLGLHVEDKEAAVVHNRSLVTEAIGWPFEAWTCAEQVHGSEVFHVTAEQRGMGRLSRQSAIQDTDAMITDEPGVLLASLYADCVPLYFYDPVHRAVGLAHAGWKGTVLEIARKTIEAMGRQFDSLPHDIKCAIGPSIDSCCYEVDGPVIDRVQQLLVKLNVHDGNEQNMIILHENGKAHINLKEINRQIMIKAGILPSHIEISHWCTGCRTDLFYSHRVEGGPTGRMASWIGISER